MWLEYKCTADAPEDPECKVFETLFVSAVDRLVQTHCRINDVRMNQLYANSMQQKINNKKHKKLPLSCSVTTVNILSTLLSVFV